MRYRPRLLAGVLLAGVLLAGCSPGSSHAASAVASLPGHGGSAPPGQPLTEQQSDRDMVSFTQCMRGHGVQMSDPYHRPGPRGPDPGPAHPGLGYRRGLCGLLPPHRGHRGAEGRRQPSPDAPELAALTRYAQCMRNHDIGMLDPTPAGALSLGNMPGISDEFGRSSPQFRAADQRLPSLPARGRARRRDRPVTAGPCAGASSRPCWRRPPWPARS